MARVYQALPLTEIIKPSISSHSLIDSQYVLALRDSLVRGPRVVALCDGRV